MNLNPKLKGLLSDFVRVGTLVAAVLVIVLNASSSLSVPAQWIAYVSLVAGILNAALGYAKPYVVAAVKGTAKK